MICCDNCYRSFHESCCGQFSPVKGAWLCPNCYNLKQDICKNSGKKLYQKKGMKNEIIYQCSLCGSRILSSSTNVPMSLVLSSSTNINYFLNKYERFEVLSNLNLLAAGETEFKNVEDILRKIARSNSGQVHAFHICTSCLNISKTPILKNKFFVQGSDKIYLKIKYKSKKLSDQNRLLFLIYINHNNHSFLSLFLTLVSLIFLALFILFSSI